MSDKAKRSFAVPRTKRRIVLFSVIGCLIAITCLLQILYRPPPCNSSDEGVLSSPQQDGLPDALRAQAQHRVDGVSFQNLNTIPQQKNVLILSMIKPATVPHLSDFFKLIRQLTYPHLSLAILVMNPGPTTVHAVRQHIEHARLTSLNVKVYVKTYDDEVMSFVVTPGKETVYELQPLRRAAIARARTFLLQSALTPEHDYTLWLDPLLTSVPPTLVQDMMEVDADIVVPNTMIRRDGNEWGHDKRNWQETELSVSLSKDVPDDFVFMEGWVEFTTHRFLMIDMATTEMQPLHKVPLDGIGSTCILTKANVHREGINYPAFPYKHQIDTEGFAKAAKAAGYSVYGLPAYKVYHSGIPDNAPAEEVDDI